MKNNRLNYLIELFNVYDLTNEDLVNDLHDKYSDTYQDVRVIDSGDDILAYVFVGTTLRVSKSGNETERVKYKVIVSDKILDVMVLSDPTKNKINTQWMLGIFTNLLKDGLDSEAVRFIIEDLPQAGEYLRIFEANKRKDRFKRYSKANYVLKDVADPSNINQYKSLSQLFDAVDPFIIRDPSEIEKTLSRFVDLGEAIIPVKDRRFTVFIPLTVDANVIFTKFSSWCTAKPGNTMYKSYTSNHKKPNGDASTIYIVIDNRFFDSEITLENNFLYQIHFETNQVHNRNQTGGDFFSDVINNSEGVSNFFNSELTNMAKEKFALDNNVYINHLIKFGWTQVMFDLMSEVTPIIKLINKSVPKLANLSRFTELRQLIICDCKLTEMHESLGVLNKLESLSISKNKIRSIPKEIGNLKKLTFMNLSGNPIRHIPEEIKYLDKTNGGSLLKLVVNESDIGVKNYKKLKELLPSTMM